MSDFSEINGCEVVFVEPEDRVAMVEEVRTNLVRYGRVEDKALLDQFCEVVRVQGGYVREFPLAILRATSDMVRQNIQSYISGVNSFVEVKTDKGSVSVRPMVLQYEGLDASKGPSDENPAGFLVLPFSLGDGTGDPGLMLDEAGYRKWFEGLGS